MPMMAWSCRPDRFVEFLNRQWTEYTGLSLDEALGWRWIAAIHPDDRERLTNGWSKLLASGQPGAIEARMRRRSGEYHWFLIRADPVRSHQGDTIRWYGTNTDIEDLKRTESLRAAEKQTLEMIADGASLKGLLNHLCSSIDAQVSPSVTTVLLMDPDGKHLWQSAGPQAPPEWISVISPVPVAMESGLCGTAAFLKERVIVTDVATDPNWPDQYREHAIRNGIRAAWSQPILTKENQVLGTFAVYCPDSRAPTDSELALVEGAGHIALIAIERQRSHEALKSALDEIRGSEAKLRRVMDTIPTLAWCNLPDGSNEFLNKRWHDYTGLSPEESHGWAWQAAFHPEDLPRLMVRWRELLASGEPGEIDARLRRHDGVFRWLRYPKLELHLICDNYGTHKHPAVKQWLAAHPRFELHFTPTSASWLNLVERWFGLITSQAIRRGSFQSVARAWSRPSLASSPTGTKTLNPSAGANLSTRSNAASAMLHLFTKRDTSR